MKSILKFFFLVYAILSTGFFAVSCIAPFVNPSHSGFVYFSGLAFPFVFLNFILIALYFGVGKKKFIFLFLLVPGVVFGLNYLAAGKKATSENEAIDVYTFNSYSEKLLHDNAKMFSQWKAYAEADENKPDIICLQEHRTKVEDIFPGTERYDTWTYDRSNLKIATHYKIISGGEIKDDSGLRFAIYADLEINGDTVRVYTFHLYSNKISTMLETAEKEVSPDAKRIISGGDKLKRRIYDAAIERAHQAKKLRWHMDASPYPVITCGDMNETAQSFTYRKVKGGLNDSFSKGKFGMHPTYRKNPSWVRIDYIFSDDVFDVVGYETIPFEISDHRPVRASLVLE